MDLGDRKKLILGAIINDYIQTAEPVSSKAIAKKHEMGISSATIRNEMADLEQLGYLEQPHTSAGRVPSDKGYRLYVDELMDVGYPTQEEVKMIKNIMQVRTINEMEKIIQRTSKLLSEITQYTSAVLTPSVNKSSVSSIQVLKISQNDLVAIVVTNTGIVKHIVIKLPISISNTSLIKISNMLNEKLTGLTIDDINLNIISSIQKEMEGHIEIFQAVIPVLYESLKEADCDVHLEGATNIFHYPEYNDIDKARDFISLIEKKSVIKDIIQEGEGNFAISIGSENENTEVKNCSIIKASYNVGGKTVGKIGIIGPTRMDYSRVTGVLKCFANIVNEILNNFNDDRG